jgi:hypothetical protein
MHKYVLARRVTSTFMVVGALFVLTYGLGELFAPHSGEISPSLAQALLGIGVLLIGIGLVMRAGLWIKGPPPGPS